MSRTDDFAKAGQALAETKRTSEAQAQCRYDFDIAAEYGYQYAVDKIEEYLLSALEHDLGYFATGDFVKGVMKFMKEL